MINANVSIIVNDSLEVRLQEWASTYRTALLNNGIVVSALDTTLVFTSFVAGFEYGSPVITQVNGDLAGEVVTTDAVLPNPANIDLLIYKFFNNIITIKDFESHTNRDFY